MSNPPRPRGRPKGTGIDDRDALRTISSLLVRDPSLKPTTAIHMSGVTDPSVVRRLRDKLKSIPLHVAEPARRSTAPSPASPPSKRQPQKKGEKPPTSAAQEVKTPPDNGPAMQDTADESSPPNAETPQRPEFSTNTASTSSGKTLPDPQLEALRLSAEAAAAVSRLYLHCVTYAAQTNPMSLALRSQTVMSQWIAGMLGAQMPYSSGTEKK